MLTGADGYVGRLSAEIAVDQETVVAAMPEQSGMVTGKLIEPDEIARAVLLLARRRCPARSARTGSSTAQRSRPRERVCVRCQLRRVPLRQFGELVQLAQRIGFRVRG
ncbi:hypothetical protein GCM10023318_50440 [Nocardia callitridis]|uniref:Uncharacterized protein n=1 Tax=Nocardia callitridis TaxID=648753 RepID=A0ABP9KRP6_9NOCA